MPRSPELVVASNLAVAALVGLAVGFERERSGKTEGPDARFAGVRTFFMLGLLGGVSGHLLSEGNVLAAVALVAAGAALSVIAYAAARAPPPMAPPRPPHSSSSRWPHWPAWGTVRSRPALAPSSSVPSSANSAFTPSSIASGNGS
jgi:hypothetical protein